MSFPKALRGRRRPCHHAIIPRPRLRHHPYDRYLPAPDGITCTFARPARALAPGGHIGLFIGRQSQAEYWTPILAQVRELSRPGGTANASTSTSTPSAGGASGKGNGESNGLLSGWGDLDGAEQILRAQADAGDEWAVRRLAELLAESGDLDGGEQILRARADAGDESAASRLAELLAQRGHLDGENSGCR